MITLNILDSSYTEMRFSTALCSIRHRHHVFIMLHLASAVHTVHENNKHILRYYLTATLSLVTTLNMSVVSRYSVSRVNVCVSGYRTQCLVRE